MPASRPQLCCQPVRIRHIPNQHLSVGQETHFRRQIVADSIAHLATDRTEILGAETPAGTRSADTGAEHRSDAARCDRLHSHPITRMSTKTVQLICRQNHGAVFPDGHFDRPLL